jgi:O-antigen/teichoic acid export membrane protein
LTFTPDPDPVETELGARTADLTGTVVRGAGVAGLGYITTQVLTLGIYLALARLATPDDFGEFAAATIVVTTGGLFTESGMLAALIHRPDRIDEAASTAVISTAVGGLVFGVAAFLVSPLIGDFFHSDRVGALAEASSGLLFIRSLRVVPEALLQRRFSFWRRMLVEPVGVITFGTAAVIAAANGLGPWALVIGYYVSAVTDVLLSWLLLRWRPRFRLASFGMWRELVGYGRHVLTSNILIRLSDQVPTLLVGRFVGKGALGQYRYTDRLASTPLSLVLAAGSYVILPAFARISDDQERIRGAFQQSLRWFSVIATPMGFIFIPFGIPLAVVLFGETWRQAGEAVIALGPFVVAASFCNLTAEVMKAMGQPRLLNHVNATIAVCCTLAMVALLGFGLVGVAAGVSVGTWLGAAFALRLAGRLLDLKARAMLREIWPAMAAGVVMVVVGLPLARLVDPTAYGTVTGLLLLAAEGAVSIGAYLLALQAFAPDTFQRIRHLLGFVRGSKSPG